MLRGIIIWACVAASMPGVAAGARAEVSKQRLFVVSGTPVESLHFVFPVGLLEVDREDGVLRYVRELSPAFPQPPGGKGIARIQAIHTDRVMSLHKKFSGEFVWVEMDRPFRPLALDVKRPEGTSIMATPVLRLPDRGLVQTIDWRRKGRLGLEGKDVSTMAQHSLDWATYRYARATGFTLADLLGGASWFYVRAEPGEELQILLGGPTADTGLVVPSDSPLRRRDLAAAYVSDPEALALVSRDTTVMEEGKRGSTTLFVVDRRRGEWNTVPLPGGATKVRGFGEWVAGFVAAWLPPQGTEWIMDWEKWGHGRAPGPPAEYFIRNAYVECPGRLFLYHVPTKKLHWIHTGNPDSEIVLAEGDTVYYRVHRSIYRAAIGPNGVGPAELVVEAPDAEFVHWAFTVPRYPLPKAVLTGAGDAFYAVGRHFYDWGRYEPELSEAELRSVYRVPLSSGEVTKLFTPPEDWYVERVEPGPADGLLAVLLSRNGVERKLQIRGEGEPTLQVEVSARVLSFVWEPGGNGLLYQTGVERNFGDHQTIEPDGVWVLDPTAAPEARRPKKIADQGWQLRTVGFHRGAFFWNGEKTRRYDFDTGALTDADLVDGAQYAPDGTAYLLGREKEGASGHLPDIRAAQTGKALELSEGACAKGATDFVWGPTGTTLLWNEPAPGTNGNRRTVIYDLRANKVIERLPGEVVGCSRDRSTVVVLEQGKFRTVSVPQ